MCQVMGTGGIIAFFVLLIIFIVQKVRTPKQSLNMTMAHHKHIPLILLKGIDHFADLFPLKTFIPEVLESLPIGKGAKKRNYRFVLPQKANVMDMDIQVDKDKNELITKRYMQALNDLNTEPVFLRGVNAPILAGVTNRSIAASFPFLAALNWTKDIELLVKKPNIIEALRASANADFRSLGDVLNRMSAGVSLVDFHAVYKYVDSNWDQTIQDSISERDKTDGRLERADDKDKPTKTILLLILGCLGMGVIIVAAAYMLGGA